MARILASRELVKENLMLPRQDRELMKRHDQGRRQSGLYSAARRCRWCASRGPEWFYTYMRSFYRDEKSSTGWNNTVFPKRRHAARVARCGRLAARRDRTETHESESVKDGKKVKKVTEEKVFDRFEIEKPGSMTTQQ